MEERRKLGPISGVGQLYLSFGLIRTGQFERATEEGSPYLRVAALYNVGRKTEAYEDAYRFAADGFPGDLFSLFLTEHRYRDLVDYVEERWPSVSAFAAENPGDEYGHGLVSMIAFAYQNLDETERFHEAMQLEERHLNKMIDQGVSNFVFSGSLAFHEAMTGDLDAAFEHLQHAVDSGWVSLGEPSEVDPRFSLFEDDARFEPIKETMLATLNRDRALVGLDPFEDYGQVLARVE